MLLDAVCRQHDWSKRLPTCGVVGFVRNQHDSCQFPSGRRGSGIEAKAALKAWLAGVPGFNVDIMLTSGRLTSNKQLSLLCGVVE